MLAKAYLKYVNWQRKTFFFLPEHIKMDLFKKLYRIEDFCRAIGIPEKK